MLRFKSFTTSFIAALVIVLTLAEGCRKDELIVLSQTTQLPEIQDLKLSYDWRNATREWEGMYLLNEGNMGSNKSTLDYLDFATNRYHRNIYAEMNPTVVKELGDVGNDIKIYGNRVYAVINCSHKVEVLDLHTGKRLGKVDISNCRYIAFKGSRAYVTSYVGPVSLDPALSTQGEIVAFDTATLAIEARVSIGRQPDELVIVGDRIYAANSGGYTPPNYDNTVSEVQILSDGSMVELRRIPVDINLFRIRHDRFDRLWVASRGDYYGHPSRIFVLERNPKNGGLYEVTDTIKASCLNICIHEDILYFYSVDWSYLTNSNTITYGRVDMKTKRVIPGNFITDGTAADIVIPYGIAVHPTTGFIFITDAKNYVSSGDLRCYSPEGKLLWKVKTGDIPAHMAFVPIKK